MGSDAPRARVGSPVVRPCRDLHRSPREARSSPRALEPALPDRTTRHAKERRRGAAAVPPRAEATSPHFAPEPPDGARREGGRGPVDRTGVLPKPLRPAPHPPIRLGGSPDRACRGAGRDLEPQAESIVDRRAREIHDPTVSRCARTGGSSTGRPFGRGPGTPTKSRPAANRRRAGPSACAAWRTDRRRPWRTCRGRPPAGGRRGSGCPRRSR